MARGIAPGHEVNAAVTAERGHPWPRSPWPQQEDGEGRGVRRGLCSTCFHRDAGGFLEGRWEGRRDKWMPQLPKIP